MRSIGSFDWIRVSMAIKYGLLLRLSVGSIGFFDRFDSLPGSVVERGSLATIEFC